MTRYERSFWGILPSSVKTHASDSNIPLARISPPSRYRQTEDDSAQRERLDALLREAVNPANGTHEDQWRACEDDTRWRREWEEEVQRWVVGQRRPEQGGTIHQQREADHAARTSQQGETESGPITPVSSASATTASASGPITVYPEDPCNKPDNP